MKYFKKTAVVFIATALNFLFSYAIHFFLGRFLGPAEYGRYGVVLNLIWVTVIPSTAIVASLVKFSAEFNAKKEFGKLKSLLASLLKFSLILNIIFMCFYILFSYPLSELLGGGMVNLIIIVAISLPISGIASVLFNSLQGVGKVYPFSLVNSLSTLIKLIFVILFVFIGFGAFGAFLALIFSGIGVIFLCLPFILQYFKYKRVKINNSHILNFALPVLFTNFFINLVLYFDLFFVSSILGAEQAGFYGAAVTLCRAFLMSSSILAVFFPEFSKEGALNNLKKLRSNLKWALFYTSGICLIGLIAFWLFPEFIINLTYSGLYIEAIPVLKVLSVGYSFYALFTVLLYALWAVNEHKVAGLFGIGLFVLDVLLLSFIVPFYGLIGAAFVTTGLLVILFFFSLFLLFSKILRKQDL
ncbi:MAG: oligosaccharide flippase family protein [Candidatus Nanoarchaeia archaeon]|jgi:O-antigen/teichoic acid export membrane protein